MGGKRWEEKGRFDLFLVISTLDEGIIVLIHLEYGTRNKAGRKV